MHPGLSSRSQPSALCVALLPPDPGSFDMTSPSTTIRLRDSPATVQSKLGLNDRQWDNFKNFARRSHNEYCAGHPSSRWANVSVVYTAVPEPEKLAVIRLMYNLCVNADLFPASTDRAVIESGIEQRLHQVRRTWQQTLRTRTRPSQGMEDDDAGVGSAGGR